MSKSPIVARSRGCQLATTAPVLLFTWAIALCYELFREDFNCHMGFLRIWDKFMFPTGHVLLLRVAEDGKLGMNDHFPSGCSGSDAEVMLTFLTVLKGSSEDSFKT